MVRKIKKKNLIIAPNLERAAENEFILLFPDKAKTYIEKYDLAMDALEKEEFSKSESILNSVVKTLKCHFESYNSLIDIALGQGNQLKVSNIFKQGEKDVQLILENLKSEDMICWKYGSNRDFLTFVYNLGVRNLNAGNPTKAREIFKLLLKLNPSDEQDVSEILVDTLFELKDYDSIIEVAENYDKDRNPSMIFNEILSLYIIGKLDKATALISNLNSENMRVYLQLEKENSFFQDEAHKYVPFNSLQNKFLYYWENFGEYWSSAEGALEFLKSNVPTDIFEIPEKDGDSDNCHLEDLKTCSIEAFEENLKEKNLKESTIKEHLDNIAIFEETLSSKEKIKEKLVFIFREGISKSRLNKLVTTLNQYFRFSIEDKDLLKEIIFEFRNLKDNLLSSM